MAGSYMEVVDALRFAVSELSAAQRDAVFGGNAIRVYDLKT
jgi:predicted TIM-barrel fold metal-dependent hydrolase